MKIIPTELDGVYLIAPAILTDKRGYFVKIFNDDVFRRNGMDFELKEHYYTSSTRGVIRGMHFQVPPCEHTKIVYLLSGTIIDAVLDVRKDSPAYGEYISLELHEKNRTAVCIPPGFAHGFKVLSEYAVVGYMQSSVYSPEHDKGVLWDSFGMDWEIDSPVISDRDRGFPALKDFESPF